MAVVSVIIPTFNRAVKTARAITSVLYQRFEEYEIIVVDDGSTDETEKTLHPFKDRIRYVAHTTNQGVSAARNTGIEASTAPLIAFLDSDDYWLPDKLGVQTAFFNKSPNAMICQTEETWIRNGRRTNPGKRHLKPSGDIFEPSLVLCLVSPSAVMLKRTLLDEVGVFDEGLPACEDYDLWLRIACRYPVFLIRQSLVIKEGGHPDQLSARFTGMDRFRIKALEKLLLESPLRESQKKAALTELSRKCRIYGTGCLKRRKKTEAAHYFKLPSTFETTQDQKPCF
ncbi:MAG: glycosyltransferase family 2 protein [Deltaproteobacteria bacterium]|nr:glycosyltransferase family 2 protein [Deltaproteobacteria bacterium]